MIKSQKVVGGLENTRDNSKIYKYDDDLCFVVDEDCFHKRTVHFVCPKHHTIMTKHKLGYTTFDENEFELICPTCEQSKDYKPLLRNDFVDSFIEEKALALLDSMDLKNAKLIRLDDSYAPELKTKNLLKDKSEKYFLSADIKTDKDGDTIVILYVGYKGQKEKTQIFIKPEKMQLTTDHKDMDPAKILAKIELTLKDRKLMQKYD